MRCPFTWPIVFHVLSLCATAQSQKLSCYLTSTVIFGEWNTFSGWQASLVAKITTNKAAAASTRDIPLKISSSTDPPIISDAPGFGSLSTFLGNGAESSLASIKSQVEAESSTSNQNLPRSSTPYSKFPIQSQNLSALSQQIISPALSSTTPSPSLSPDRYFAYVGCQGSSSGAFSGFTLVSSSPFMDVEVCLSDCSNSAFAGLYETDCYCGDDTSSTSGLITYPDAECSSPCPGNPSETCGGLAETSSRKKRDSSSSPSTILLTVYQNTILVPIITSSSKILLVSNSMVPSTNSPSAADSESIFSSVQRPLTTIASTNQITSSLKYTSASFATTGTSSSFSSLSGESITITPSMAGNSWVISKSVDSTPTTLIPPSSSTLNPSRLPSQLTSLYLSSVLSQASFLNSTRSSVSALPTSSTISATSIASSPFTSPELSTSLAFSNSSATLTSPTHSISVALSSPLPSSSFTSPSSSLYTVSYTSNPTTGPTQSSSLSLLPFTSLSPLIFNGSSSSQPVILSSPPLSPTYATTSSVSLSTPTPLRNTGKRGLVYTNISYTQFYSLSGQNSQVSWAYDYYSLPNASNNVGPVNPALTFVPLLYNDASSLTSIWSANVNYSIANYATDAILAFNEPDLCNNGESACMNVSQSVAGYLNFIQPYASITPRTVLLGAPAVTNAGPPASLTYLSYFLGNCTGCTIDFIPIHWYSSPYSFSYLQSYVEQAYVVGGNRSIWITEMGMDSQSYADADVQKFLKNATTWLDAQSYVKRYVWFGDFTGYLINAAGTGLSAQGVIWNNWTGGYVPP